MPPLKQKELPKSVLWFPEQFLNSVLSSSNILSLLHHDSTLWMLQVFHTVETASDKRLTLAGIWLNFILKFSLRGGAQERKKRKKRKNSQVIISLLPLQRIRHHFTVHHRMQFLSTISDAYFDFKDTTLYSLSKLKRYSPQYLY